MVLQIDIKPLPAFDSNAMRTATEFKIEAGRWTPLNGIPSNAADMLKGINTPNINDIVSRNLIDIKTGKFNADLIKIPTFKGVPLTENFPDFYTYIKGFDYTPYLIPYKYPNGNPIEGRCADYTYIEVMNRIQRIPEINKQLYKLYMKDVADFEAAQLARKERLKKMISNAFKKSKEKVKTEKEAEESTKTADGGFFEKAFKLGIFDKTITIIKQENKSEKETKESTDQKSANEKTEHEAKEATDKQAEAITKFELEKFAAEAVKAAKEKEAREAQEAKAAADAKFKTVTEQSNFDPEFVSETIEAAQAKMEKEAEEAAANPEAFKAKQEAASAQKAFKEKEQELKDRPFEIAKDYIEGKLIGISIDTCIDIAALGLIRSPNPISQIVGVTIESSKILYNIYTMGEDEIGVIEDTIRLDLEKKHLHNTINYGETNHD